ncbi:MAG: stage II sporulation protein P [Firmicutes bacterium]|nr:stage II sporulation protein P [Bacillota bacterium]
MLKSNVTSAISTTHRGILMGSLLIFPVLAMVLVPLLVPVLGLSAVAFAEEEVRDGYFSLIDVKTGKVIMQTGHVVYVGDRFLDADNTLYEVVSIKGNQARVRAREKVDLAAKAQGFIAARQAELQAQAGEAGRRRLIATYHTHSDESYVPTDGAASIAPRGGIYKVGATMTTSLERFGVDVNHSYASHLPHDGAAYERSRRTAMALIRQGPDAIFDVHRDAAPLEQYVTTVNGRPGARVMIVVGRENPNMRANEGFAYAIKDYADRNFPGLVRGIFYGKGGYNQDLSPRALLFEVGSQENSRYAAERSMATFIDALPALLYGITAPPVGRTPGTVREQRVRAGRESRGAFSSIAWIIGTVVAVGFVFLLVNEGNLRGLRNRLERLRNFEFANMLGMRGKSDSKEHRDHDNEDQKDSRQPRQ